MEHGSILLAPQMKLILASLNSVAFATDGIQKNALNKLPLWQFESRPQRAVWINSIIWEI